MYFYQAYGLNIRSDFLLTLPEGGNGIHLYIQHGQLTPPILENTRIPRQGIEAWFGGTFEEAYLQWPGVATFCAKAGTTLIVDTVRSVNPEFLNLFILSEALGIILHQRGIMLLHASAIKVGEQAVIFAGVPGAGKSTMAAAFAQRGYLALSDDMVAITFDKYQRPMVVPAFGQIKIWQPSVQGLGYEQSELIELFAGSQKRIIRQSAYPIHPFPLVHLFFLEAAEYFSLEQMQQPDALMSLVRFFSCPNDLLQGSALAQHFQQCMKLLNQIPVWQLKRSNNFADLQKFVTWIEQESTLKTKDLRLEFSSIFSESKPVSAVYR